jgi:hypothetical protein
MIQITLTETRYIKNPDTKTTFKQVENKTNEIFEKEYFLTTNDDTIKFFRRLGGKETITRSYTCAGYKIIKLTSTSPDKQTKIVREFEFKDIEKPKETLNFELLSLYGKYMNLQNRGLITDELKEKFVTYKTSNKNFDNLNTEFNNLNTL